MVFTCFYNFIDKLNKCAVHNPGQVNDIIDVDCTCFCHE